MNKSIWVYIIACSIFISCSHEIQKNKTPHVVWSGVDIEKSKIDKDIPLIEERKTNKTEIGPLPVEDIYQNVGKKRIPIVALELGPALNRGVVYSAVFKGLERNQISVHIVSGVGMGALSAALYARGDTPELIEWKFHNLMGKLVDKKIYSRDWKSEVHKFIKKEFKNRKIESLQKQLILPVYDKKKHAIRYITKGSLYETLISNFEFSRIAPSENNYISAMEWKPFSWNTLKKYGADVIISFDSLGNRISFVDYNDEHIFGLFNKTMSLIKISSKNKNGFFHLPVEKMDLDSKEKIQDYILKTLEFMDEKASEIKEIIEKWSSKTKSSNQLEGLN